MTLLVPEELALPARYHEIQHREAEIEAVDADEGTMLCRVVPYDLEVELDHGLWESFAPAAFERATNAPTRVKMWHEHGGPLIGHALSVEDKADGCWIRSKFAPTLAAQEARELARCGTLTDVSVTFKPMRDWIKQSKRADGVHIRHARAGLLGFALVGIGAYAEHAFVASTRDADAARSESARAARLARWESLNH